MVASGGHGFEVVRGDYPYASALHLFEEGAGFDCAHEEDNFYRLNVGPGGNHIDGDGDAGVVTVAE